MLAFPMSEPITVSTFPRPASAPPAAPVAMLHGDPCTLVIFGAVGDLARRKLMPAVYYLAKKKLLAEDFRIIGVGIESLDRREVPRGDERRRSRRSTR